MRGIGVAALPRLVAYFLTFGLSILIGLISLPVVVTHLGVSAWTAISLGQTIGAFGCVVCAFGYGVFGPTMLADVPASNRTQFYVDSLVIRALFGVVAAAAVVPVVWVLSSLPSVAVVTGLTGVAAGLSATWFLIGDARPTAVLVVDTLPRVGSTAIGLALVMMGHSALTYAAVQLAGLLVAAVSGAAYVMRLNRGSPALRSRAFYRAEIRAQAGGCALGLSSAFYAALPVVVVAWLVPQALTVYALGDKLLRFATGGGTVVTQIMQGWVPAARGMAFYRRVRASLRLSATLGIVAAATFALLGPELATLLTRGQIVLTLQLTVPLGVVLGVLLVSQCTGLVVLSALDLRSVVTASTVVGAAVGAPLLLLAGLWCDSGPAVAWAVVVAEVLVLCVQFVEVRARLVRVKGVEHLAAA